MFGGLPLRADGFSGICASGEREQFSREIYGDEKGARRHRLPYRQSVPREKEHRLQMEARGNSRHDQFVQSGKIFQLLDGISPRQKQGIERKRFPLGKTAKTGSGVLCLCKEDGKRRSKSFYNSMRFADTKRTRDT